MDFFVYFSIANPTEGVQADFLLYIEGFFSMRNVFFGGEADLGVFEGAKPLQ